MTSSEVLLRPELAADQAAVRRVLEAAFPDSPEAGLVDRLREVLDDCVSWVAVVEGELIGHILFTPVTVRDQGVTRTTLALGPMAVAPAHQRRGIGSLLVEAGLQECTARGAGLVFVVGHPEYYPRFGFVPAAEHGIHYRSAEFDPYLFVRELRTGALADVRGWLEYHPEFERC